MQASYNPFRGSHLKIRKLRKGKGTIFSFLFRFVHNVFFLFCLVRMRLAKDCTTISGVGKKTSGGETYEMTQRRLKRDNFSESLQLACKPTL